MPATSVTPAAAARGLKLPQTAGCSRIGSKANWRRWMPMAWSCWNSSPGSLGCNDQLQTARRLSNEWFFMFDWVGFDSAQLDSPKVFNKANEAEGLAFEAGQKLGIFQAPGWS